MDQGRSVRVFALLEEVAKAGGPLTAHELADRSGLPKATVYRLCDQLLQAGYLRRQIGGRGFVPGGQLLQLAQAVFANKSQHAETHAVLAGLARDVGETCNLSIPDGLTMVYWDRVEAEWPLRLLLPIGTRVPMHATASGKLYLASLEARSAERLFAQIKMDPYTDRTVRTLADLRSRLERIRSDGYSIDNEEFIEGMTAVAVPVADMRGRFFAGLAVHAPTPRMSSEIARQNVPRLRLAAEQIRECLNAVGDGGDAHKEGAGGADEGLADRWRIPSN